MHGWLFYKFPNSLARRCLPTWSPILYLHRLLRTPAAHPRAQRRKTQMQTTTSSSNVSVHAFIAISSYLTVIRLDTHSMDDTGYGLSDFTYPVSVPANEPVYRTYHYDNSSLHSSSPGSSAPHTPSIDGHPNTSFCPSLTTASSGDSLQQSAPSTYLEVPKNSPRRARSVQDRSESLCFVH